MFNVMTVDVEDYFHVEAFAAHVSRDDWHSYPVRVDRNVDRILELFDRYNVKGTFFVLGWVAERFPLLVGRIAAHGHEIGCHSHSHQRITAMSPQQFRADLKRATLTLQDQLGRRISSYRAPSFSVVERTMWALEILAEEGYTVDSSIFPVHHDIYGVPDAKTLPHWYESRGRRIFEFPPSTVRIRGNNWPVGGGGYLRLYPYGLTYLALQRINKAAAPGMVYFHPWEIDPGQPTIKARLRSTLRHYVNLSTMEQKIERLLQDFRFVTLAEACSVLNASQATVPQSVHAKATAGVGV